MVNVLNMLTPKVRESIVTDTLEQLNTRGPESGVVGYLGPVEKPNAVGQRALTHPRSLAING